ncbi:hypothetical protein RIR_jg17780.t1 [Rhizophagus irregularis DAOM 181602=DAOM 197198]|nr:hypothetical protein RIR_jg17780.t1 [Rhizophagus irregularis DAOM 181602=DAOM 197198]
MLSYLIYLIKDYKYVHYRKLSQGNCTRVFVLGYFIYLQSNLQNLIIITQMEWGIWVTETLMTYLELLK